MISHPGWAAVPGPDPTRTLGSNTGLLCWQYRGPCYRTELRAPPSFHECGCHTSTPAGQNNNIHPKAQVKLCVIAVNHYLAYYNQDVRFNTGNLCCHQMPIFLSGEISCVEQLQRGSTERKGASVHFNASKDNMKRNIPHTQKQKMLPWRQLFQSWT